MGQSVELLERVIKALIAKNLKAVSVGKAKNIDVDGRTCDVEIDENVTIFQCRLNAITDSYDNHIVIVPKEDSYVAFTTVDNQDTNALVIAYSDIERVAVTVGESKIEIEDKKIVFNAGKNGLVKITDLVSKLNAIESAINTHTHPYTNVSAAATTSVTTNGVSNQTTKSDLEDTKILHS